MFTQSEFQIMIDELLHQEPASFSMLCRIAEKSLKKKVHHWCSVEPEFCGRGFEDDLMQEIYLKLIQVTVSGFLLKDGVNGPVNNDPDGFRSWMFTVATNQKNDFFKEIRKREFRSVNPDKLDELQENGELDGISKTEQQEERIANLKQAFSVVMSSSVGVYKILTWLAQFLFMLDHGVTKIESNDEIVETFGQMTLFGMYDLLVKCSEKIAWLDLTDPQKEKLQTALQEPWNQSCAFGDVCYETFFMKYRGEKSGKKSISDWVNRMNDMVRRETGRGQTSCRSKRESRPSGN